MEKESERSDGSNKSSNEENGMDYCVGIALVVFWATFCMGTVMVRA